MTGGYHWIEWRRGYSYLNAEYTPNWLRNLFLGIFEDLAWIIQVTLYKLDILRLLKKLLRRGRLGVASNGEDLERGVLLNEVFDKSTTLFTGGASDENCGHCMRVKRIRNLI